MYSPSRILIGLLLMGVVSVLATVQNPMIPGTPPNSPPPLADGKDSTRSPYTRDPHRHAGKTAREVRRHAKSGRATKALAAGPMGTGNADRPPKTVLPDSVQPESRGQDPGSWLWPRLNEPRIQASQATVPIHGHDPAGPRKLELWRIGAMPPQSLGQTISDADGHFHFGRLALPQSELSLVVTPPGVDPKSVTPLRLRRPSLSHPHVRVEYEPQSLRAYMTPTRVEGEFQIHDDQERLLGSFPIDGGTVRADLDPAALSRRLYVTQVLPNGDESEPRLFHDPDSAPVLPST